MNLKASIHFLKEIVFLLEDDYKQLPKMTLIFLGSSLLEIIGLGLMTVYLSLIISKVPITDSFLNKYIDLNHLQISHHSLIIWLGLALVLTFAIKGCLAYVTHKSIISFTLSQWNRLRHRLMRSFQTIPYSEYIQRNSSEYIQTIHSNTSIYTNIVLQTLLKLFSDFLIALSIIALLIATDPGIVLILLITTALIVFLYDNIFRGRLTDYGEKVTVSNKEIIRMIQESTSGLKEIRILGVENYFFSIFSRASNKATTLSIKASLIQVMPKHILELVLVVLVVMFVFFMIKLDVDLISATPKLMIFSLASLRLIPIANSLAVGLNGLRYSRFPVRSLFRELENLKKVNLNANQTQADKTPDTSNFKTLEVKNLSFQYSGTSEMAINNLSLDITMGESIGIMGSSGAGKTTLIDLLLGLLPPKSGTIFYNKKELGNNLSDWSQKVAYLPQEVFIFDDTIRNNISIGYDDVDFADEALDKVVKQVQLDDLIERLPNGYDTILGERGTRLSGGQRQRIALARALFHKRDVLIMDESTSAIDNETEKEILEEIQQLKGQKTTIVIAHRISTLKYCDRIYRLERGSVVDKGSYESFLSKYGAS